MAGEGTISFENNVVSRLALEEKINRGEYLLIAGDEDVLASLPSGNWIAGTIPYFMTENGGKVDQEQIYVTTISGVESHNPPRITLYDVNSISRIATEAPENGFTVLILPASSDVHLAYAQNAPDYPNMFFSPIVGWASGVHLDELDTKKPKVGFGPASGMLSDSQAVAMHISISEQQVANIKTVNLFTPGEGDSIRFKTKGFTVSECVVNGEEVNFAQYITDRNVDTRLPLVADYSGCMVNASVQEVVGSDVKLYAPVFPDFEYHFSEGVLALDALKQINSKRILIICGKGGRDLLEMKLAERGAIVDLFQVYKRIKIDLNGHELVNNWQQGAINGVIISSIEILNQLFTLVPSKDVKWLLGLTLYVPSQRVANHAYKLGVQHVVLLPSLNTEEVTEFFNLGNGHSV